MTEQRLSEQLQAALKDSDEFMSDDEAAIFLGQTILEALPALQELEAERERYRTALERLHRGEAKHLLEVVQIAESALAGSRQEVER